MTERLAGMDEVPKTAAPTRVAFDVGPLQGPRTGVGVAAAGMLTALGHVDAAPLVMPYLVSFRARPAAGTTRLPVPAVLALRWWSRFDWPTADRFLPPAQVVHGTNYVVPPTRMPRLISVYDCWFLRHPDQVHPNVGRAAAVLRRAASNGATLHCSSHATAQAVGDLLGDVRTEVIPLGAPEPPPEPAEHANPIPELQGRTFVLALGTIERRKNLPRLIQAFGLAGSETDDALLVLAGAPGDDSDAVDAAIAALPRAVTDRVILAGRVDDDTKSWLLHHAAVLAYPSLDEGFGFPLLEAMAVDLPVVASRSGSIPEVAGDAALLADAHDAHGLGEALVLALGDSAVRARLVTAGHARVAAHDWNTTGQALAALYARLALEGSPR